MKKEDYIKLRDLAISYDIVLSNVKKSDCSADVLQTIIKSLGEYKSIFPEVFDKRYRLTLSLNTFSNDDDFAITRKHIITLNSNAYRDIDNLQREYQSFVEEKWFVQGTDWRAIIHHEFGHVVANVYKIDPLKIACEVTGLGELETLNFVMCNLSNYAFSLVDGTEIIAEVFADISSNNPCEFSREYYDKVLKIAKEGAKMNVENAMSARNRDTVYWTKNKEWFTLDKERQRFELTDKAPDEARRSFEKYKIINSRRYK